MTWRRFSSGSGSGLDAGTETGTGTTSESGGAGFDGYLAFFHSRGKVHSRQVLAA